MPLSLDDIRNVKFRMNKRSGYEVLDVDEFVDRVEESFAQLREENANLRHQVESLQQSAPNGRPEQGRQATAEQPPHGASAAATVVTTSDEASSAVVRLVQLSTEQAERVVSEAASEADRITEDARRNATQVTGEAQARAERVEAEAREHADVLRGEAQTNADQLDADTERRRGELLGHLERQRDQLTATLSDLRRFEETYRHNLIAHLQAQVENVRNLQGEPADRPDGASPSETETPRAARQGDRSSTQDTGGEPSTPRLDALLSEQ